MAVAENGSGSYWHPTIKVSAIFSLPSPRFITTKKPSTQSDSFAFPLLLSPAASLYPPPGRHLSRLHHQLTTSPLSPSPFSLSSLASPTPHVHRQSSPDSPSDSFTLLPYMMSPPSNNVTLAVSASTTSSRASFPTQNDRERSRNAKAQARHRAKRKAYVEQVHRSPSDRSSFASVLISAYPTSSNKQSLGSKQRWASPTMK